MNTKQSEKHAFAISCHTIIPLATLSPRSTITITNKELIHRLINVLRLNLDDAFIVFDNHYNAQCTLRHSTKKEITISIEAILKNRIHSPSITFLLPLLKRTAFEEALYSLVELGANTIQLLYTQKARSHWTQKDEERAFAIMIAAAEQSKNFALPALEKPVELSYYLQHLHSNSSYSIFFDAHGTPLATSLESARKEKKPLCIMVGPEGDCTQEEKKLLNQNSFSFAVLTPTVLRAQQAVALSMGILRSLINDP